MKILLISFWMIMGLSASWAQTPITTGSPQSTPTLTFEQQKEALDLERLQLENEKLKFEMDKLKSQATQTAQSPDGRSAQEEKARVVNAFQASMSQKAEALAKDNKDKENILVLDLSNNEIWYKGVRYNISELYDIAEDNHWKINKRLDEMDPNGDPRYRYQLRNLSLLKYQGRKRGIMEIKAPVKNDDFLFLTPEGVSFSSGIGDIRNAYQNAYFSFDGEDHENRHVILKYIYAMDLDFSDRLNFDFDKDDKMVEIRYGVLDER